ncbi:regulating synaptic membrane exocytosis protein 2 isoform X2 [Phlebotomus argentipes]|uniref:regulating synaptic membrane exocytosis protein 2 isoform X2 n=1 Tax=Phlebotomus argentipes TaxID=94469 RepID=UPI00289355BC|nr:regulating synaptic membrane exocytosis protein 2 isoform X2 [Phlebotomus argentipes]
MADMPDLSHLTAEERAIIESVMMRQKQEEERENEIMKRKQDEVAVLEDTIRHRAEQQKKAGIELDATCHICLKTKFADGIGHICHYCSIRCCARCGGKVTLRSTKTIWVCILCRKKQELLSKTGQWIHKNTVADGLLRNRMESDMAHMGIDTRDPSDKRPKLERARSAAEKENLPLQRSGSMLRRQYSQQEQPTHRMAEGPGDIMNPPRRMQPQYPGSQMYPGQQPYELQQQPIGSMMAHHSQQQSMQQPMLQSQQPMQMQSQQGIYSEDDPRFYQGELDGLMRQHPHLVHPKQQQRFVAQQPQLPHQQQSLMDVPKKHKRALGGPYLTQQRSFSSSEEDLRSTPEFEEIYDRRDKPSVLVTSPGSPDLHSLNRATATRYANRLTPAGPLPFDPNVGGRIQVKLGFEGPSLQLIVTIICAAGLTLRNNGVARNPYVKIFLLPGSDKSKRRTKTLASTCDPRWGQTFVFSGLRRADLHNRLLEITIWDYIRYGANDFLGEVILELGNHPLDDEAEWYILQPHQDSPNHTLRKGDPNEMDSILTPTDHLSPPSTTSRLSDSDTSECDIDGITAGRDGASLSSLGSSSSPPPEIDLHEVRRSRRDMSPQGRKRVAGMVSRDYRTVSGVGQAYHNQQATYTRRNGSVAMSQRSHSAAPSENYRSGSPRRGSLSPPDDRSATATPTGSPKKRQLPQVPQGSRNAAIRERLAQDFEDRPGGGRFARHRVRHGQHHQQTYRSTGMGGWERHYTGLSDSDLAMHSMEPRLRPRHSLSPDKDFMGDFGDSDMESVVSVTSSAFSTQSERPRGSRGLSGRKSGKKKRGTPLNSHTASVSSLPREFRYHSPRFPVANCIASQTTPIVTDLCNSNPINLPLAQYMIPGIANFHNIVPLAPHNSSSNLNQPRQVILKSFHSDQNLPTMYWKEKSLADNWLCNKVCSSECNLYNQAFLRRMSGFSMPFLADFSKYPDPPNEKPPFAEMPFLSRSHSLISDDNIIEIEYDSDTGWKRKRVHRNAFGKVSKGNPSKDKVDNIQGASDLANFDKEHDKESKDADNVDQFSDNESVSKEIDMNFKEYEPTMEPAKSPLPSDPSILMSTDSIKTIIDEVRTELLEKPQITQFLSDDSSKGASGSDDYSFSKVDKSALKKYCSEKAIGFENQNSLDDEEQTKKTHRRIKANEVDSDAKSQVPPTHKRNSSYNSSYNKKTTTMSSYFAKRRSSSLDELSTLQKIVDTMIKGTNERSSVSINETPEYFHYQTFPVDNTRVGRRNKTCASHLSSTPTRTSQSRKHASSKMSPRSGEYDLRERRREGNGNGRSAFRQRDLDRDASDREQRGDSQQSSFNRSTSTAEGTIEDKIDGSLSDTAVGLQGSLDTSRRKPEQRSPKSETPTRDRERFGGGMGKKSNSTSQLSATGRKRRLGFGKKGKNSFTVHRSEEVLPGEMRGGLSRGSSASSDGEGSGDGDRWSPSMRTTDGGQLSDFIEGLGPGQLVGRQVLGASSLGDIQLSLCHQKGYLEVEVIRARGLQARPGSKVLPAPYVKVYLVSGKKCIAKAKTTTARKTLDPLYQQQLSFREPFAGCILQVTVWGDYGRIEGKKVFMGVAQIMLDELNLSNIVIGWYKLFGTTSLVSGPPSLGLSRRSSLASLDSLKL